MKQFFVLGLAGLLALAASGCATRGYARRQAAAVNDKVGPIQTQITALSEKHETDVSRVSERITTADNKLLETVTNTAQANASAAKAEASAARADASAAQANANGAQANAAAALAAAATARADAAAARVDATNARNDATNARAEATAAQERAALAQNTPPPKLPAKLPTTGSPLPLIALSGLLSMGVGGALRLLRR